jgi:hypothetical protein
MSCRGEVLQGNFHSITDDRVVVTVNRVETAARQRVQKLVSWIIRAFVSEGEEVWIDGNLDRWLGCVWYQTQCWVVFGISVGLCLVSDPTLELSLQQNRTINVGLGRVAKGKTVSETKAKFLSTLLLE